jgi:DNA-binding XRE family transcriptional regulator
MEKNFKETLNQRLNDASFKEAWDASEPEYAIVKAMIQARKEKEFTQKELSVKTGIAQTDISKLENGNGNPSIRTLKRLAEGLGKELHIEFR